jgi:hypothetical protein
MELEHQRLNAFELEGSLIVSHMSMMTFTFGVVITEDPAAVYVDIDHRVFEPFRPRRGSRNRPNLPFGDFPVFIAALVPEKKPRRIMLYTVPYMNPAVNVFVFAALYIRSDPQKRSKVAERNRKAGWAGYWRNKYNGKRPHSSLGQLTPGEFADRSRAMLQAQSAASVR